MAELILYLRNIHYIAGCFTNFMVSFPKLAHDRAYYSP